MGKIQMSRGKTHQAFNYPFCLLCPVISKLVEKVISLGWERYGGQIRIWEVTHFWKVCFWNIGQVKSWEGMPKPLCTHDFHFSPIIMEFWLPHAARREGAISSTVWLLFPSLLHTQNAFWVLLGWMGRKGPRFCALRRPFLPLWASWELPSHFYAFFLFSPSSKARFWVASELEKIPMIFGWFLSPFFPTWNP